MNTPNKISQSHLSRKAMVYVRQSTIAQVREHTESTARQYALVQEAARLGWSAERISVIDADLGVSGRTASAQSWVKELVGRGSHSRGGRHSSPPRNHAARDFARLVR